MRVKVTEQRTAAEGQGYKVCSWGSRLLSHVPSRLPTDRAVYPVSVCKHVELVDALCASGADVAQPDVYQAAPLHYAAQLAGIEPKLGMRAIAKLLSRRTSVECRDNQQRTPLLWAASAGCADACAVLLKAGANVEAADKDGLTGEWMVF